MSDERFKIPAVVELMDLIEKHKDKLPCKEVPAHLAEAATICEGAPRLIGRNLAAVNMFSAKEPTFRVMQAGKSALALWRAQRREDLRVALARFEKPKAETASAPTVETATEKPKGKPGRKSNAAHDAKIAHEYNQGLEDRLWAGQADYRRKKHPGKTNAWLTLLLQRVEKRKKS